MPAYDGFETVDRPAWDDGEDASDRGGFPAHLAPLWDKLDTASQLVIHHPWKGERFDYRGNTKSTVQILRSAGWSLEHVRELASWYPESLGKLRAHAHGAIYAELWDEVEADEARRAKAKADAKLGRLFDRLRLLCVEDVLNAPLRSYLLDGLLAPGEMSVWWGKPKCGKSFLLLRLAYGLAQGVGMWGREAVPVPVVYVAAEGASGIGGRVRALHETMGAAPSFHMIAQSVDLFDPEADLNGLIAAVQSISAKLVVLDTLARVMGAGDENSTRDMNIFIRNMDRIREETGAHVAIVHHGGWDGSHARGSIALIGAADLVVKVEGEQSGPRSARVEYAKDDAGADLMGFKLDVFDLPPDPKGKPRATCIAVEGDAPTEVQPGKAKLTPENATLLREIENSLASGEGGERSPEAGMPLVPTLERSVLQAALIRSGWLLLRETPGELRSSRSDVGKIPDSEHKRLQNRLTTLQSKGIIGRNRDCVWLVKTPSRG